MNRKRPSALLLLALSLSTLTGGMPRVAEAQTTNNVSLEALTEGKTANGFRAEALYLNDSDKPFGARLRHAKTGFTLDYLQIQSVPQVFLWVNSFPTSEHGEPHTQEHLLLGKGEETTGGRDKASILADATAFEGRGELGRRRRERGGIVTENRRHRLGRGIALKCAPARQHLDVRRHDLRLPVASAAFVVRRRKPFVVGITGSQGKTSTKDLVAHLPLDGRCRGRGSPLQKLRRRN